MSALGDYYHGMAAAAMDQARAANVGAEGQSALHHAQADVQGQLANAATMHGRAALMQGGAAQTTAGAAQTTAGAAVTNSQANMENARANAGLSGAHQKAIEGGDQLENFGSSPGPSPSPSPSPSFSPPGGSAPAAPSGPASNKNWDDFATGTSRIIAPGDGTVDTTKANLANGEAVLNRGAAEHLGQPIIRALNAVGAMRMGMVPGAGARDPQVEQANAAQTSGKTGHYAKGVSKAGPKGKAAAPSKAGGGKTAQPQPQPGPSDTPPLDQVDPQALAAAMHMGVLGQQVQQQAQPQPQPGQTPMGMM